MRLPPEDRPAWIADASRHLQDRAGERQRRRAQWRAAGADPIADPDRTTPLPDEQVGRQLDRRRAGAARLPRLDDGRADPHSPLPQDDPANVGELDSWARALAHLQSVGLAGLPPAPVRRALASFPERYASVLPRQPAA